MLLKQNSQMESTTGTIEDSNQSQVILLAVHTHLGLVV